MSTLIEYAKREFQIIGYKPIEEEKDGPNKWMQQNILQLLEVFSSQGHSGGSALYCISVFAKLAAFAPLSPLTGEESEWSEVSPGLYQNKRCSRVFKNDYGAYDAEGRVFRTPDGQYYANRDSRISITFPYTPLTEFVDVKE